MASHSVRNKKSNKPPPKLPFLISHRLTSHQYDSHDLHCGPCVLSGVASAQSWFRIKNVSQPLTGVGCCGPGRGDSTGTVPLTGMALAHLFPQTALHLVL